MTITNKQLKGSLSNFSRPLHLMCYCVTNGEIKLTFAINSKVN